MDATKIQEARMLANSLRICSSMPACEGCQLEKSAKCFNDLTNAAASMIESLTEQETAQQPIPQNIEIRMKVLDGLLSGLDLSESAASAAQALLEALDAGVMISGATVAGGLTVALLADRLSWAEHYYYDSDCPDYWLYKKLLLTVIPAICPELREPEEGVEEEGGTQ